MVERLIQTIKRKLGVMTIDRLWSSEGISTIVASLIQIIRLIPNRITKIAPFEAHFGRKPNTGLSNIATKPSKQNLSYKQIKNFASDRRLLKQPVLTPAAIWDMDQDSEPEFNIQYREAAQRNPNLVTAPLQKAKTPRMRHCLAPRAPRVRLYHQNLKSHSEIRHQEQYI